MTRVSAQDLTSSQDCKVLGCTNEAPARGRYAGLCEEHRSQAKPAQDNGTETFESKLKTVTRLAREADKLRAKAAKLERDAAKVRQEASAKGEEFRSALARLRFGEGDPS